MHFPFLPHGPVPDDWKNVKSSENNWLHYHRTHSNPIRFFNLSCFFALHPCPLDDGQWRHTGFNVYCGKRILPRDQTSMENLARYIIRASFSLERMTCVPEAGSVVYQSKDDF